LEKKEEDKWTRAFDSFDKFLEAENPNIVTKGAYYFSLIVYEQEI